MNATELSKAILLTPAESESIGLEHNSTPNSSRALSVRLEVDYCVAEVAKQFQRESHICRMILLRKELGNLESTAWKYQPIKKYICL